MNNLLVLLLITFNTLLFASNAIGVVHTFTFEDAPSDTPIRDYYQTQWGVVFTDVEQKSEDIFFIQNPAIINSLSRNGIMNSTSGFTSLSVDVYTANGAENPGSLHVYDKDDTLIGSTPFTTYTAKSVKNIVAAFRGIAYRIQFYDIAIRGYSTIYWDNLTINFLDPTTAIETTLPPVTNITSALTTVEPTTEILTSLEPTTEASTSLVSTTDTPVTETPTTIELTTEIPNTLELTTQVLTTTEAITHAPSTTVPTQPPVTSETTQITTTFQIPSPTKKQIVLKGYLEVFGNITKEEAQKNLQIALGAEDGQIKVINVTIRVTEERKRQIPRFISNITFFVYESQDGKGPSPQALFTTLNNKINKNEPIGTIIPTGKLVEAIVIGEPIPITTLSDTQAVITPKGENNKLVLPIRAIIGITVGGFFIIAIIAVIVFILFRKNKKKESNGVSMQSMEK